jgi:hypothetical protein
LTDIPRNFRAVGLDFSSHQGAPQRNSIATAALGSQTAELPPGSNTPRQPAAL